MDNGLRDGWEYGTLEDAVTKGSSNISLNKVKEDDGDYPLFGAKGFNKNISFYHQEEEYLEIIKDGAGIGRISQHPKQSSILGTMQYLIPKPVLTLSSVTGFIFNSSSVKYTSALSKPDAKYWVNNGDLLITRSNTPKLVGHVAISSNINEPTIYPDLIMKINPDNKIITTKFLFYQLKSQKLREIIMEVAHGANPTMKKLESIYKQKLKDLSELKKLILKKAFNGELT